MHVTLPAGRTPAALFTRQRHRPLRHSVQGVAGRDVARGGATLVAGWLVLSAALIMTGTVLVHLSGLSSLREADEHLNVWIAARRTGVADRISLSGTYCANTLSVIAAGLAISATAAWRRCYRAIVSLWGALAVELSTFLTTNYTVARPRPHVAHIGSTPSTFSFPSGHVAATFVTWTVLALLVRSQVANRAVRAAVGVVPVVFVSWVAFSRVYAGQHHLSDVGFGLVLGVCALAVGRRAARSGQGPEVAAASS